MFGHEDKMNENTKRSYTVKCKSAKGKLYVI